MENGVFTVDWWNVHNGTDGGVHASAGSPTSRDFGLLSSGTCLADGVTCEPALNTPFAPYHALADDAKFARPGDQLIRAGSSDPLVKAHAARRPNGDLAVLLRQPGPDQRPPGDAPSTPATRPRRRAQVYTFANGATAITTASRHRDVARTLPPYSLTTLVLHPVGPVAGPAAPGQPTAQRR